MTTTIDPKQQRTQTDESLQAERNKSDLVIAEHRADIVDDEEAVVERAREQADAVLAAAREKADEARTGQGLAVMQEREHEDAVLNQERRAADVLRRRERTVLNALVPLEREKTDLFLLTERNRSDDALANRDDFMGIVSHDLRNLLNNIVLNASAVTDVAVEESTDDARFIVTAMGKIVSAVGRMNRLIGDLVDVASIDAGKLAIRGDVEDVVAVVHEAVDVLGRVAAQKNVGLEVRVPTMPLHAWCDEGRLLQVLNNLVNNALKFTPPGGNVVVEAVGADDSVTITVADTGIGIPAAQLESVFEQFAQVASHDKRGLGLGLYISRCIIDAHGGTIFATSILGAGSTFHVRLPRTKTRA